MSLTYLDKIETGLAPKLAAGLDAVRATLADGEYHLEVEVFMDLAGVLAPRTALNLVNELRWAGLVRPRRVNGRTELRWSAGS